MGYRCKYVGCKDPSVNYCLKHDKKMRALAEEQQRLKRAREEEARRREDESFLPSIADIIDWGGVGSSSDSGGGFDGGGGDSGGGGASGAW